MKIRILMISYNRAKYTELALRKLCETATDNVEIYLWDNDSNQETKNVIKKYESHPNVVKVIYNDKNEHLRTPTNWFWSEYGDCDYLSKVDDDCLVPDNWLEILVKAHSDIDEFGVLGCWRYFPEDFNQEQASKKIKEFAGHTIMRNCWVEGSGYLMKGRIVQELGLLKEKETFTDYCIRAAMKGYVNGWYYPFLFQEHMDDPRAINTGIKNEADFNRLIPLTAKNFGVSSVEDWVNWMKQDASQLQVLSYDPNDYISLSARIKRKAFRLINRQYIPLVK